jgi:hypothetical protein
VPVALGVNVTLMVQLPPAAKLLGNGPQVFVWAKFDAFVPLIAMALTVIVALPVFDSVTACAALLVPTCGLRNVRVVAESVAFAPEVVPDPAVSCARWQPEFPQSWPALWVELSRTQRLDIPYHFIPNS